MGYWNDKRVLVTGGVGFIGVHVVRRLVREGAGVTVVDNLQSGKWEDLAAGIGCKVKGVKWKVGGIDCTCNLSPFTSSPSLACIEADVRDAVAIRDIVKVTRPDVVLHLAANASVPGSVGDPAYDFQSNAMGTFNVLDAVRLEKPDTRVVAVSSGAVYGEPTSFPLTEASPLAPISPYGASKLAAETEARMFHSVYQVPVVIARFFNTYGPGMPRFVILDFLKKLQKDPSRLEILGNGRQVRDFNYVEDTVSGLLLLAEKGTPGEAYNIASGVSHSVTELAHVLLDVLGLAGKTELTFTGDSWAGDAQRWEVDVSKARSLGYKPATSLREGVVHVAAWYEYLVRED